MALLATAWVGGLEQEEVLAPDRTALELVLEADETHAAGDSEGAGKGEAIK